MDALRRNLGLTSSSRDWLNNTSDYRVADQRQDQDIVPATSDKEASSLSTLAVKSKLVTMWNNVKYGKTLFSLDSSASAISSQSQVWMLAQMYHRKMETRSQFLLHHENEAEDADAALHAFMNDFASRIWLTYRKDLQEFEGTCIKSDCGWGCMIRSGQMMVANALAIQHLGRDWRWKGGRRGQADVAFDNDFKEEEVKHRSIIRLFADNPSDSSSPFSIHKLVAIAGDVLDKRPGDWFGPASTSHLLKIARDRLNNELKNPLVKNFQIYVATNTTIYKGDVIDLCERPRSPSFPLSDFSVDEESFSILGQEADQFFLVQEGQDVTGAARLERGHLPGVPHFDDNLVQEISQTSASTEKEVANLKPSQSKAARLYPSLSRLEGPDSIEVSTPEWTPVLILVPTRLGSGSRLNPIYSECIKTLLTEATCVGVIGGRPRHSLYFVGFQDDYLIHLDPHLVQDRVDVFRDHCRLDSFHCWSPRKMSLSKMDPSCCFGFLIASRLQFDAWCHIMPELVRPVSSSNMTEGNSSYPMFSIVDGRAADVENSSSEMFGDSLRRIDSVVSAAGYTNDETSDAEDFVFL